MPSIEELFSPGVRALVDYVAAMPSKPIDVFAQDGFDVTTKMVNRVDNQGEPCDSCAIEGRYIDATVYGVKLGECAGRVETVDCCVFCVPDVIRTMNPTACTVKVELGDSLGSDWEASRVGRLARLSDQADDRMHSQYCTCVHPDGA